MKNLNWKFKVATNDNTYYATSLKAINHFLRENDFVLTEYYPYIPLTCEKKIMQKCGWGVWGISDTEYFYLQQTNLIL
jgi:hypothetical protein